MKISGIYKIQSIVKPERFYIGSGVNIRHRWACHLHDLRKNKHHSPKLQNHYHKYGEEDLVLIIIEPCFPQFLTMREQAYIDSLKPWFNICPVAGSILGLKRPSVALKMIGNKNGVGKRGKSHEPWNKGKKGVYSKATLEAMSENNAQRGKPSVMKGKKHTEATLLKMRKPRSEEGKQNMKGSHGRLKGLKLNKSA